MRDADDPCRGKSDKDEQPRDIPYEKWREEHGVTGASPGAAGAAALEARRKQSSDDARHDGEDSEKKGGLLSKLRLVSTKYNVHKRPTYPL